jgi:hypothetical protein
MTEEQKRTLRTQLVALLLNDIALTGQPSAVRLAMLDQLNRTEGNDNVHLS